MSETTRTLLLPHHTFEDRGGVEVKGKVRALSSMRKIAYYLYAEAERQGTLIWMYHHSYICFPHQQANLIAL